MKYKLIVAIVASLLAVAESAGQSAYERARLESYRWAVVFAGDEVGEANGEVLNARFFIGRAQNLDEPLPFESLFENQYGPVDRERYSAIADARMLAAESSLATSRVLRASAEARLIALEGSSDMVLKAGTEAYSAIVAVHDIATEQLAEIVKIHDDGPPSVANIARYPNLAPSSADLVIAWTMASLAALSAERAEAIVAALNDGGEMSPELLEPLPTDLFKTVAWREAIGVLKMLDTHDITRQLSVAGLDKN